MQIMCAWCQKVGVKRYSLSMGSELKNFCSEKCFAACRRAYFKRNKVKFLSHYQLDTLTHDVFYTGISWQLKYKISESQGSTTKNEINMKQIYECIQS